jgi:type IV pilus assembly protein PilA
MNARTIKNKQGFTIIEVVLVLAIAALIFLMVFIALPALQRNQRDTARKTILGKVASSVTSYQSNNRGQNPANIDRLSGPGGTGGYVDDTKGGPGVVIDNEYDVLLTLGAPASPGVGAAATDKVQIFTGSKCNDTNEAVPGTNRQAAVIIQLENGDSFLCQSV